MKQFLHVTVRFLVPGPTFHGQRDGGEPEWPPSPLRLFQALVDAAASRWRNQQFVRYATPLFLWLERLRQPEIVVPAHMVGTQFRIAVPNNDLDAWAEPISKGNEPKRHPNELKTMKQIRPVHLTGEVLHYLFALPEGPCPHLEVLRTTARSMTHLGWGIDMTIGDAAVVDAEQVARLDGVRWYPSFAGGTPLRVPKAGTLDDLTRKHADFLGRVTDAGFRPVPPVRTFDIVRYRRTSDPVPRPHAVFKLIDANDDTVTYPQSKLIHIAGMVRHAAIELMKRNPPRGQSKDAWVEAYVAGHKSNDDNDTPHTQFSYVPLQSIGHAHTDPGVRRVMIVAPLGDEMWLEHLAARLDGMPLQPLPNTKLPPGTRLERIDNTKRDGVRDAYINESVKWASVTPVILPGHDDHKPAKTRKLIEKGLQQSGVDQPCEFEWSPFSQFRKMLPAHKYQKDSNDPSKKILINYVRPDHLMEQSAVHLRITFAYPVPGPITIGAGRHCGLGVFAGE